MSDERPLICAFMKVRNEVIREGNIYRVLENMDWYCDAAVILDDGSTDGTFDVLLDWWRKKNDKTRWVLMRVEPDHPERRFEFELRWKQRMLDNVHKIKPQFVFWLDGDEVLNAKGTRRFRDWVQEIARARVERAWRFHYTQFWRNTAWARTDDGFDDGYFIKLWRYSEDLSFETPDGTHHQQFPVQIRDALGMGLVGHAPFEVLHYGNFGKNLAWKCIQYYGGLGGVDRHLLFAHAAYRPVPQTELPDHCERVVSGPPSPYTAIEVERIRSLRNLQSVPGLVAVVIPAYNRASTLGKALDSVIKQTYQDWIALVLDDGSDDETRTIMRTYQEWDQRIFYARFKENRGGVAMNEIGMALACEMAEFWTRLGSDDWWGPNKLKWDMFAFDMAPEIEALYGTYVVVRDGTLAEACNEPRPPEVNREALLSGMGFCASWANCAVRTSALKRVRQKYGNFCDPRLRNMEDFLFNARIARETTGWHWRGVVKGKLLVNPPRDLIDLIVKPGGFGVDELEAVWTASPSGASAATGQYVTDENLTRQIIMHENINARLGRSMTG